jgi:hypothetical protein
MDKDKRFWGLLRQRQCLVPTWQGWLLLLVAVAGLGTVTIRQVHPFLAPIEPLPGGYLVVEGWAPDYVLEQAIAEFNRNHYEKVLTTGGPLLWGAPLSQYKTYAELAAATIIKLGLSSNVVQAVPARLVVQDRTYAAAMSFRDWVSHQHLAATKIHLISEGPHARRSRLLFQKALGQNFAVGVTAIPLRDYDPHHWWRSSAGVRAVLDESVAYAYARLFFHPAKAPATGIGLAD